jgi:glycine oxidase
MKPDLAIIGGGLLGRLLAWRAALSGLRVNLFDANDRSGSKATAWVAAGMIAPQAEVVDASPEIAEMGRRSLSLWPDWLPMLPTAVHYSDAGTLLVWQRSDAQEAARFEAVLRWRDSKANVKRLNSDELNAIEPALSGRFQGALYLPAEAHVHNRELLPALADALDELGVECHWNRPVQESENLNARLLVDCRGKSAKDRWKELRGVRGEIIRLHLPGINLKHMIRLLHPRHQLYVISRPGGNVVVGATTVESDDNTPMSVRGALELLSAAFTVLPELGEARIVEFNSDCRPALPENRPEMRYAPATRLLELNGLYRHGFLLSPAIVEKALGVIPKLLQNPDLELQSLFW